MLADRVALLQDGTITHVGEHRELLATVPGLPRAARRRRRRGRSRRRSATAMSRAAARLERRRPRAQSRPAPDWRGVAADDRRRPAERDLAGLLAGRSRRLLRDLLRPLQARVWCSLMVVGADRERRAALGAVPRHGGHRPRHPADPQTTTTAPLLEIVGIVLVATVDPGDLPQHLPGARPARSARTCCFELRRRVFGHFQKLSARRSTTTTRPAGSSRGRPPTSTRSTSCSRPASTA